MTVSSLIFDLDGTIIDSRDGVLASFAFAAQEVFPRRAFDPTQVVLGPPVKRMFQITFPTATDPEADALVAAFRRHYDAEGALLTKLFEGAEKTLAECARRGLSLHIATNKPLRISKVILAHLGMDKHFQTVLASDSIHPPFPNKAALTRHLLQSAQLTPSETIYIGDSTEDAMAAEENGLRFIFATYGYGKLTEEQAGRIYRRIHTFAELPPTLN